MKAWQLPLLFVFPLSIARADQISEFDAYRYKLELNTNPAVCRHMERVYNNSFRTPWDFRDRPTSDRFPRLEGVERNEQIQLNLRYSVYPSSPEFEAIEWREGRQEWPDASFGGVAPILIGTFDIDNDGKQDVVIKSAFMSSLRPADGGRSAGGEDLLRVLRQGSIEPGKPVNAATLSQTAGAATIGYMTLTYTDRDRPVPLPETHSRMWATSIRPFALEGKTYLSVYVPWKVTSSRNRREWMWVMQYHGGGRRLGSGEWERANVEKICRFRMLVVRTGN